MWSGKTLDTYVKFRKPTLPKRNHDHKTSGPLLTVTKRPKKRGKTPSGR